MSLSICFSHRPWVVGAVITVLAALLSGTSIAHEPLDQAVTYQINPAHSGSVWTSPFGPPLVHKWSRDLGNTVSYPLIAEGKVFVAVTGNWLIAIDAETGQTAWGPVVIPGSYFWCGLAYSNGRVFVVNHNGLLRAFDAGTGLELWSSQMPGQYSFTSPPSPYNGIIYFGGAGGGGNVYAVRESDGAVIWNVHMGSGDYHCSPAIGDGGVFVNYACGRSYRFDLLTGAEVWRYTTGCSGGGGRTPVYYNGRFYGRLHRYSPKGFVLDAATGVEVGRYDATPIPAFWDNQGFFVTSSALECRDAGTLNLIWRFAPMGGIVSAPIVVNGTVYVGGGETLYAADPETGGLLWSTNVGSSIWAPDEHNARMLTGLGAGEGILVVPAGNLLVAYGNGNRPPIVECSAPVTAECDSAAGAEVVLKTNAADPEGDRMTVSWYVDDFLAKEEIVCTDAPGSIYEVSLRYVYPVGTHVVDVVVHDRYGSAASCSTTVDAIDAAPPSVSCSVDIDRLWPPNGAMCNVGLQVSVVDASDANPVVTVGVFSDEDDVPATGGPKGGPDAEIGECLKLRADRLGTQDGRAYLMVVSATDASGKVGFDCCSVVVPHSNSPAAVESVLKQAAMAEEFARTHNGSAPQGFFAVGTE